MVALVLISVSFLIWLSRIFLVYRLNYLIIGLDDLLYHHLFIGVRKLARLLIPFCFFFDILSLWHVNETHREIVMFVEGGEAFVAFLFALGLQACDALLQGLNDRWCVLGDVDCQ